MNKKTIENINEIAFLLSQKDILYEIMISKNLFWFIFTKKGITFKISINSFHNNYSFEINGKTIREFKRFDGLKNLIKNNNF